MDHIRFGPSRPSAEDRPVITGHTDKEAWITGLIDYVNSMKEICPDAIHPPDDWLSKGISVISLDQGQLAAALSMHQGDISTVQSVMRAEVTQPLEDMQKTLDEHTQRHTANELNARQVHLSQREKDRWFCVAAFSNKTAQYHAGDLFDIKTCVMDLAEHAKCLAPNLALIFGQPVSNTAEVEVQMDCSKVYTEE